MSQSKFLQEEYSKKYRPSPTTSPNQSDDEDNDAADAVEGLLEMAAIGGISTDTFEGRNGVKGGADVDDDEYGW